MKTPTAPLAHYSALVLARGAAFSLFAAATVHAQEVTTCAALDDSVQRLACYDRWAGRNPARPAPATSVPATTVSGTKVEQRPSASQASALDRRWGLDADAPLAPFTFQPHRQNYVLPLSRTNAVNTAPYQPTLDALAAAGVIPQASVPLDATEARFQLSLKVKVWQDILPGNADLWLGYTQQSAWQVYNRDISSPFRNTDYTPELMLALRPDVEMGSWRWRLLTLGLVHQSNGQSKPLSRSWNRVYADFGIERGPFTLSVRPWYRLKESAEKDDNPDIQKYLGHGDVVATYQWGNHQFGALVRQNVSTGRGAGQLDWSFPISGALRGYVQVFNGYGFNLLDYSHRQTVGSVGFILTDRL